MGAIAQENKIIQELESFNEVKVFDRLQVILIKGTENKAIITGEDTDEVKIINKDGLLKIRTDLKETLDGNDTKITLYYTEILQLVDVNEGARIKTRETLTANYLTLKAQEGGEINAIVATRNLDAKSVTGGKLIISGVATNQEIIVRTGGDFRGKELKAKQTDVTILAGGKAIINSEEYVDANVTAGGTIEIYGKPAKVIEDKALGGTIVVR